MSNKIVVCILLSIVMSVNANNSNDKNISNIDKATTELIELNVFKSLSCNCCQSWINHIQSNGFETSVNNIDFLSQLKEEKGISPRYRSCHTAESMSGFIFEGHVAAKFIKQYLENTPDNTLGLSVPAMPIGTPGMEMGDRFTPYQVLLLHTDGTSSIYAEVTSYEEQF